MQPVLITALISCVLKYKSHMKCITSFDMYGEPMTTTLRLLVLDAYKPHTCQSSKERNDEMRDGLRYSTRRYVKKPLHYCSVSKMSVITS